MFKFLFQSSNIVARTAAQFAVVGMAGSIGVSVAATSASANLDAIANNAGGQTISSGTLTLNLANGAGSNGFSSVLSNMAPGDSINYNVNLTNGSLAGLGLKFYITDGGVVTPLTRDNTNSLTVTILQCSQAWTAGTCTPGSTTFLPATSLYSINNTLNSNNMATIIPAANVPSGQIYYLRFTVTLPSGIQETVTNGVLPNGTFQGKSTSVTWNFKEVQRAATDTEGQIN